MSIRYTVRPCNNGDLPLVDHDSSEDDISDYIDEFEVQPRGSRSQNHTMLVRVCKKILNNTDGQTRRACRLKKVKVESPQAPPSEGGIPMDILEKIERDGEWTVSENRTEAEDGTGVRQRREADGNWTDGDISSGSLEDGETAVKIVEEVVENITDADEEVEAEEMGEMSNEKNGTTAETKESNDILVNSKPLLSQKASAEDLGNSEDIDHNLLPENHIHVERERFTVDLDYNYTAANTSTINLSFEYDDYDEEVQSHVYADVHFISYTSLNLHQMKSQMLF